MKTNILKNNFLYKIYFNKILLKRTKKHFFIYLSQGIKHGSSISSLISTIKNEYKKIKMFQMYEILKDTLYKMENDGLDIGDAFYLSGLFNESEKTTFNAISKKSINSAFEQIIKQNKYKSEFKYALLMLVTPVLFILFGYIVFLPEVKAFTLSILAPVNAVSSTAIQIPAYFNDRSIFVISFLSIIFISGFIIYLVEYLKKNNPKILFSFVRLIEREFIVNHFSVLLQLMESGLNISDSVEVILKDSNDTLAKKILGDALADMSNGYDFSHTIEKYFSDYATVAFLKGGELNDQIESSLSMILSHNELLYQKLISRLIVWLPMAGETIMTVVLLIPLLDILKTTTVNAMNFTV